LSHFRGNESAKKRQLAGGSFGARVFVHYDGNTQAQAVLNQSSFFCNEPRLHFGLGNATLIDVDVHWPNDLHETFNRISTN